MKRKKKVIKITFVLILIMFIIKICNRNVLDEIYASNALLQLGIFNAFDRVEELEDISDDWKGFNNWMGTGIDIEYKEENLKENVSVNLVLPQDSENMKIGICVWVSDTVCINMGIEYEKNLKEIIYSPVSVYVEDKNEIVGKIYKDKETINNYLNKYYVTDKEIREYQEYALYEVVTKTWIKAYGGIYDVEAAKLKCCKLEDNTFVFTQ